MKSALLGVLAVILALVGMHFWGKARLDAAVAANNAVADTASAQLVTEHNTEIGELRAHLATSQSDAASLMEDTSALSRRNRRLGRELSTAVNAVATLRVELGAQTPDTVVVTPDGVVRATFSDASLSNGDSIGYDANLTLPLQDPDAAELAVTLAARLTIDTRLLWEGETPICQVSVRHELVSALPGRCIEVLGRRPVEVASGTLSLPAPIAISVGGGLLLVGLALGALIAP